MSRADRDRWNRKYLEQRSGLPDAPDPLLLAHAALFNRPSLALDVACGAGQNSRFLARHGLQVIGVDGSVEGLRLARDAARSAGLAVQFVAADLDHFRFPPATFDLVLVMRFLNRALLPNLAETLKPGGLLVYQTYNLNWLRDHSGFNRDYLLAPGELARSFPGFDRIAGNDSPALEDPLSFWIGRSPA